MFAIVCPMVLFLQQRKKCKLFYLLFCGHMQWRSVARPSATREWPWKCRPFHPSNLLTEIIMNEDRVSCLKDLRNNKTSWTLHHSQTLTNWNLSCFSVLIMSLAFSACRHLSQHYSSIFLLSLHITHVWNWHISSSLLSCWLLVSGKPHH